MSRFRESILLLLSSVSLDFGLGGTSLLGLHYSLPRPRTVFAALSDGGGRGGRGGAGQGGAGQGGRRSGGGAGKRKGGRGGGGGEGMVLSWSVSVSNFANSRL